MQVTIGTFNLNNLFSRYNFKAEVDAINENHTDVDAGILYEFGDTERFRIRSYKGRLVKAKENDETRCIANRVLSMDIDVIAVQEVEDIDTLKQFNRDFLNNLYPHVVLIEGNDPRLIDCGLLSKLPVGAVTSWQHAVHPAEPDKKIFGRDLLEVQILNSSRSKTLFTVFNNHLKSHFVDFSEDAATAAAANNRRRKRQAEVIATIVKAGTRPNSKFAIVGDMNDPPDSACLEPFVGDNELGLVDALENPVETRPAKPDTPGPSGPAWTHRYKKSGQPADYELYDQIWLSPSLAACQNGAWIDRRTKHGGDGSDHDPAWIRVQI